MDEIQVNGALSERIAAGKADPISAQERAIVSGLRQDFERKYGRSKTVRSRSGGSVTISSNAKPGRTVVNGSSSKSGKTVNRFG